VGPPVPVSAAADRTARTRCSPSSTRSSSRSSRACTGRSATSGSSWPWRSNRR
jgi:hypothetical protein